MWLRELAHPAMECAKLQHVICSPRWPHHGDGEIRGWPGCVEGSLVESRAPSEEGDGRYPPSGLDSGGSRPRSQGRGLKGVTVEPLHGFAEFAREKVRKTFPRWKRTPWGSPPGAARDKNTRTSQCDVSLVSDSAEPVGTQERCRHGGDDDPPSQEIAHVELPASSGTRDTNRT